MSEEHRPAYHLLPPSGWLNDPNGLGQRDGTFHAFYQYNPDAPVHDRICWGHATSDDLVRWRHEPVALRPDTPADADGCWSGVLVDDGGVPTLVYSGHREGELQQACLATGSSDLRTWTKDPANPVLTAPPDAGVTVFRDHCVWREDGRWRMLVGGSLHGRGAAMLFTGPDLRSWEYAGPLLVDDGSVGPGAPDWPGTAWECVDLFEVDGTHVLAFSAWDDDRLMHALALTGRHAGDRFVPHARHRLDLGRLTRGPRRGQAAFYAPQSFRDERGRRVLVGWLPEDRPEADCVAAGWAGVLSLPREVTVRPDGTLHQEPVAEVATLREELVHDGPADDLLLDGERLDLELDVRLPPGGRVTLVLRGVEHRLGRHGDGAWLERDGTGGPVPLDADRVAVRALVDHSVLEVFAGGVPLSSRSYAVAPTTVSARGAEVSGRAWTVGPAGPAQP